jgi:hypothetical protein
MMSDDTILFMLFLGGRFHLQVGLHIAINSPEN